MPPIEMPGPPVQYCCWNCSEPNFAFVISTVMTSLKYSAPTSPDPITKTPRSIPGELSVMRILTVCGRCRCVVSLEWIPVDLSAIPEPVPEPRKLIV